MRKNLGKTLTFVITLTLLSLSVFPVAAQIDTFKDAGKLGIKSGETTKDLVDYVTVVVNTFLVLAAITAAIFLIVAGLRYISARGDEDATASAKKMILYAVIGLVVIGLSAAIVNFIIVDAIQEA